MMMSAEVVNGGGGGGELKKNEEDMVQQQQVPYLGEDMITKILLKIPAESLFKTFRYVCKSWLNKISTHPDIHLNRLLGSIPPCLIIQNVDSRFNLITCFFTLTKEGMIEEQFDDLNTIFKTGLWIKACCNGLILATTSVNPTIFFYVVNPLTNHKLILPSYLGGSTIDTIYRSKKKKTIDTTAIDLVFIPSTGEYKVIVIEQGSMLGKEFIGILTFSASDCYGSYSWNNRLQWRLIEAPKQILHSSVVAINGILYWGTSSGNIVSFDASVEKFYETTYRRHNDKKTTSRRGHWGLIEIGGLLSSWSIHLKDEYDDVWRFSVSVVKDFHGGEWVNKYSVPIDADFMKKITDDHLSVLGFGNGEVIIFHNYKEKTMWALNVKLNQWWKVGDRNLKENLRIMFKVLHVNNKTVPLESIFAIE